MPRPLPYLNIILATLYFILYLQQSNWFPIFGILMIMLFSALCLSQAEHPAWLKYLLVYPASLISLLFAGFLVYSGIYILLDAIDHSYYPGKMIFLFAYSMLFSFLIGCTLVLRYLYK